MSNIKTFLRAIEKSGYPNPHVPEIADAISYNLEDFLPDLKKEIGEDGVSDFCDKAIEKLSGKDGVRVNLNGPNDDEYCYIHIFPKYYDEGESYHDVISSHRWGKSEILDIDPDTGEEHYVTIQTLIENTDMSGWGELDELLDHIKERAYNIVYRNCGFGIWWE